MAQAQLPDTHSVASSYYGDSPSTVVVEGYLKKQKKMFMSSKDFYRVLGKVMYVAPNPKKQFKAKYDLTNYNVQLSQGDSKKIALYPIDETLQLKAIEFKTVSTEERARWFKALSIVTAENKLASSTFRPTSNLMAAREVKGEDTTEGIINAKNNDILNVGGKPIDLSTLTDISQFLSE